MQSLEFDFSKSGIKKSDLNILNAKLDSYRRHLQKTSRDMSYAEDEASLSLPYDAELLKQVRGMVKKKGSKQLKYVFVVGIGGSNLGTKAIYDAVRGPLESSSNTWPKMIFVDTVSPILLKQVSQLIERDIKKPAEFLVNAISKSGGTAETITNFEFVYSQLAKKFKNASDRVVLTTDEDSKLWNVAVEKEIDVLAIPKNVGGRFSVFSAVGLFPLALAGIDIGLLRDGAMSMLKQCLDGKDSPAMRSAATLYMQSKKGLRINNNFFFNPELESVGKWYRQLMGESIGKEKNMKGKVVHAGITPIVSIGSTDLHSMAQLYFGGPRDKFTTLMYAPAPTINVQTPRKPMLGQLVNGTKGKQVSFIMEAIFGGVVAAYRKNKLPYMYVKMPAVNAYTVAQYLQFKMIEIMFLGKLFEVNTFDQPNVEDYKKATRKIMETA